MGGLEISIVLKSELEFSGRIDSEYYRKHFLTLEKKISSVSSVKLGENANFLIGPFGSEFIVDSYTSRKSFRYIRGKDVKPLVLMDNDNVFMPEEDYRRLEKYALRKNDVMVSVVGTLGNAALVSDKDIPAIFSCKSTVIRTMKLNPSFLTVYLNCEYGRKLLLRKERGAIQKGLNLDDLKDVIIHTPSPKFQNRIDSVFQSALSAVEASKQLHGKAETALLKALGLADWAPPEPLAYTATSAETFASGRLDAQFFAPRIRKLIRHLSYGGSTIRSVASPRREKFEAAKRGDFDYIEIGDLDGTGTTGSNRIATDEAPSRATWLVRPNDIITSTVRPIRRLSAQIAPDQDGYVCSSGFVVLNPTGVQPELLLTYLRLPAICELMDLFASASMYPAISEADILALPFPVIDDATEQAVIAAVQEGRSARIRARALLDAAKRAVEIAIEDNEAAALAYLDKMGAA